MDPNPYEAPRTGENAQATSARQFFVVALRIGMLASALLALFVLSGVVGIVVGFVVWSQFFWSEGRPFGFLSAMGVLLTLITGLCFSVATGATAIAYWWKTQR
jgi:hypothetical protein